MPFCVGAREELASQWSRGAGASTEDLRAAVVDLWVGGDDDREVEALEPPSNL